MCKFLDDHSRYTLLAFLRHKSDVHNAFHEMLMKMKSNPNVLATVLHSRQIMELHFDGGKEFEKLEANFGGMGGIGISFFPP